MVHCLEPLGRELVCNLSREGSFAPRNLRSPSGGGGKLQKQKSEGAVHVGGELETTAVDDADPLATASINLWRTPPRDRTSAPLYWPKHRDRRVS